MLKGKENYLTFETAPYVGLIKTYSYNSLVTDSAAASTAFATGQKTNNNYLGVDPKGQPLKSFIEIVKQNGKSTGLVTTVTITHATPAGLSLTLLQGVNYLLPTNM